MDYKSGQGYELKLDTPNWMVNTKHEQNIPFFSGPLISLNKLKAWPIPICNILCEGVQRNYLKVNFPKSPLMALHVKCRRLLLMSSI